MMASQLDEHRILCASRRVPCGNKCAACARRLTSWLVPTVELARGRYQSRLEELAPLIEQQKRTFVGAQAKRAVAFADEAPPFEAEMAEASRAAESLEAEQAKLLALREALDEWVLAEGPKALTVTNTCGYFVL